MVPCELHQVAIRKLKAVSFGILAVANLNHDLDGGNYLGGENFRHRSGLIFASNPHPGSDSIAFGGLIYV